MADHSNKTGAKSAKSLVGSVLSKIGKTEQGSGVSLTQENPQDIDTAAIIQVDLQSQEQEAVDLIEVYFELESPQERDILFDELATFKIPVIDEFLLVMLEEDEDEYVRTAAAVELARRGHSQGIESLQQDLLDPQEDYFFTNAVMVLSEVLGAPFYTALHTIWSDTQRDADYRREAMLGMESLDVEQALKDNCTLIEQTTHVETMEDDQIEVAMMIFARHNYIAAIPVLNALLDRVKNADLDADEAQELCEFLAEGMALLQQEDDEL